MLEGELGAGKTTLARALLLGLGVDQPPEGSPTFAIAHEYHSRKKGAVAHLDLYRLKHESELEEAGILEYFWGRAMIVIAEWVSLAPELERALEEDAQKRGARTWKIKLVTADLAALRNVEIVRNF